MNQCRKGILHQFERLREKSDAFIEICVLCGEKVIYRKYEKGRIDNVKYRNDHKRDFIQPYGRDKKLFIKLWVTKPLEIAEKYRDRKITQEKMKEVKEELREKRISMRKRAFKGLGKSDKEINTVPPFVKRTGFQKQ